GEPVCDAGHEDLIIHLPHHLRIALWVRPPGDRLPGEGAVPAEVDLVHLAEPLVDAVRGSSGQRRLHDLIARLRRHRRPLVARRLALRGRRTRSGYEETRNKY